MAHVRDSDTSLWLHNKLGTSNDLWSGSSICSQLNQDVLRNIRECFIDLQSQVKLKLLLSFLHIPRRNVEEWKVELEEILEVASADSDQWVSMLAELLRSYPSKGTLNFQIEENAKVFTDLCSELKKLVRKHAEKNILPLECLYLNKHALNALVGQLPQPVKHFALKRKPKSAALRAELLQKSNDTASNVKKNSTTTSVPIRCRGITKSINENTPIRGIPSRVPTGGFKSPGAMNRLGSTPPMSRSLAKPLANKKDGGIKLLEITEQPLGYGRDAKRRKKQPEEIAEMQKKEKDAAAVPTTSAPPTTPDYAAGLLSTSSQLTSVPASPAASYGLPATSATLPVTGAKTNASIVITTNTPQNKENFQQVVSNPSTSQVTTVSTTPPASAESAGITRTTTTIGGLASMGGTSMQVQHFPVQAGHQALPTQPLAQPQAQPQPQQKKGLSLSREQMVEAQEMFRVSNKVTRPEKALILGFMAGSRENPCPHLGNVITIKLSENKEDIVQDGLVKSAIVETHFQMNYSTGEWKRVKKYRAVDE